MALTDDERAELESDLARLLPELVAALADSAAAARPVELDPGAVGRVSRIDAIQQQQMVESNRRALQGRIQRVRAAQHRCEADEYGICLACGDEIAFARLKARPETLFCIACQNKRERD